MQLSVRASQSTRLLPQTSRWARQLAGTRHFSFAPGRYKQRLVILGSGWGGYGLLKGIDKNKWDVTVISPNTYFNFTPLLASCAVGTLEFRTAIEPVRRYAPKVTYYQAWCDEVDFNQKVLKCMPATRPLHTEPASGDHSHSHPIPNEPFSVRYDKLVIAVGAYSQSFEQANQPFLSDIQRRNLLNFCIVGGGPTGIEFAAELHDLLHTDILKHFPPSLTRLAKITVYDVAPNILGTFDQNLRKYTEKTLAREGINLLTRHHGKMYVKEQGEVPFGLLVWSTGLAPNPLVKSLGDVKKDPRTSSIITSDQLNVFREDGQVNPDVWAIGDAAKIEDAPLPATAQVASQKAKYMAKKLNKIGNDQEHDKPFEFHNQGSLAYIGSWKAIYDRPSAPGEEQGFMSKETGRVAWLLWRSAYFTMTLSWRNKILVPTYWFMNWIFGRDLTRF
ncbi:hypothetical protein EST38_g2629 [Candolleomyces aberdarensis]|uniref:Uncharacterized protein n=1 Tax=Candolleomyces aberdarensis TaxID=2316362 RepID=A0A4Q2DVK8_9AGAR|nr:hypothetical protein EST38_g2629 [Candolleomyces aberdarensis]